MDTTTMIYVGRFNEADLKEKRDKTAIDNRRAMFPNFKYIHAQEVKKGKKIVALDVYISTMP